MVYSNFGTKTRQTSTLETVVEGGQSITPSTEQNFKTTNKATKKPKKQKQNIFSDLEERINSRELFCFTYSEKSGIEPSNLCCIFSLK